MKTLEEIKAIIDKSHTRDDRILGFIFQLMQKRAERINKDPKFIHKFFYNLKSNDLYKNFLKDFNFDIFGLFPYSEELDKVLFRLEASGLLRTANPTYESYYFNKETKEYQKAYGKIF